MSIKGKIITSLLATVMALTPVMPAFAVFHEGVRSRLQERSEKEAERKQNLKENMQDKRTNLQEKREARPGTTTPAQRRPAVQEKRQEAKQRLAEKRKQIIRAQFDQMLKRFEAALEREKKLGERIQSRIDKAKANGNDVVQAQAALDRAGAAWQEANAALENAKGELETALDSDDPKTAFDQVRSLIESAQGKIKAVHAVYVEAVATLKGVGGGERRSQGRATSTP